MRRFIFAALLHVGAQGAAHAQGVPARDLLDLPLGTMAEPVALAGTVGDGLWNPATLALAAGTRARIGVAALTTSAAQGVSAQTLSAAVAVRGHTTIGVGLARASLRDIQRTGTDPQTLGEIGYNTMVASATAARTWRWVTAGAALRYRTGELDMRRSATLGADAGVVGRLPLPNDVRVALSSYLWHVGADRADRPAVAAATDLRLGGTTELRELRAGYSLVATRGLGRDDYVHLSGRSGRFMLRGGVLRATAFDVVTWGSRLGVGLQHARYVVGFSREERDTGLPPSYQFTLTTSYK
jgi:hypothetical protein